MAEVILRFGRSTFNVSPKICNNSSLKPTRKHKKGTVHSSTLSTWVLFVDINRDRDVKNRDVTVEVSHDVNRSVVNCCLGMKDDKSAIHGHVSVCRGHSDSLGIFFPQSSSRPGWGHLTFIRTYVNGDREEPLYRSKTGYYDILGVSPTATQAQIKTAYYKQCFLYHPDRNAGGNNDATVRFSDISEAYAVLGHKGLRRKYDRGLLNQLDLTNKAQASATKPAAGGSSAAAGGRGSAVDPRKSMFDFDTFLRSHYGDQLQRDRDIRQRKEEMLKKSRESIGERNKERAMEVGVVMLLVAAVALVATLRGAAR